MQTQVTNQPRTGREPPWYYEIYRGNQPGPAENGTVFDFDEMLKKVRLSKREGVIIRIIGPDNATQEQINILQEYGATPTFPAV